MVTRIWCCRLGSVERKINFIWHALTNQLTTLTNIRILQEYVFWSFLRKIYL
jgi:hypothetical protein